MGKPIKNPVMPLGYMMRRFLRQTLTQLEVNTSTQAVYPREVYNGYAVVNEKRKEAGMWYSTGRGHQSFAGTVSTSDGAGNVAFVFTYNDYMRFVDMGVGQGTSYEEVDTARKARFKTRYARKWDRRAGKSHRPAIMMEFRHLQTRIGNYLRDYYGYEGEIALVKAFDDIEPINLI